MNKIEIYSKLNDIFRDVFDLDEVSLTDSTTAEDIEEWDSLNHINIIVGVESEFGIKFATSEVSNLKNVGDLVNAIAKKIN